MKVYHGTRTWKINNLLNGQSDNFLGLYITDIPERAQLYADAQASGSVETTVRHCAGSAVVTLETSERVKWSRRDSNHTTLDKCEATIKTWQVAQVEAFTTEHDLAHSVMKVAGRYVHTYKYLQEVLGDKLHINIVQRHVSTR